jgi:hypothetical protein
VGLKKQEVYNNMLNKSKKENANNPKTIATTPTA